MVEEARGGLGGPPRSCGDCEEREESVNVRKRLWKIAAVLLAVIMVLGVLPADMGKVEAADLYKLSYNEANISAVGKQAPSQCGAWALAYCRTILDGRVHQGGNYVVDGEAAWWKGQYVKTGHESKQGMLRIIYDQINSGNPVCLYVTGHYRSNYAWSASGDHWVTVVGYRQSANRDSLKESDFYMIDPGSCSCDWLRDGCTPDYKCSQALRISNSGGSVTPSGPVTNSALFTNLRAEGVTSTSAKIMVDYPGDTYGDIGFYFGTAGDLGGMTKVSEYKYSGASGGYSYGNSYQLGVYYDDTYKYKWWPRLTPGTTYYYAFYCTKGGTEHISTIQSFTTLGGGASVFPLINGGVYKICSDLTGYVMEVSDGDSANGKRITLWPYEGDGAAWMRWRAVQHPDGYSFINMHTGKALDISGGSMTDGAAVQQWDYAAVDAQRFQLADRGNGRYSMLAICSGLAVDVANADTSPGAVMMQHASHGGSNQLWYFELIDTVPPVISNVRTTDVNSDGYTVLCDVTDDLKVERVTFPSYSDAGGRDDMAQNWYDHYAVFQPSSGNTYSFRVRREDHNVEYGSYTTEILAYDAAGNMSGIATCSVTLSAPTPAPTAKPTAAPTPKPTSAPTAKPTPTPTAKPTAAPANTYTLSGTVKCFGSGTATLQLIDGRGASAASASVSGTNAGYRLEKVSAGTYTLRASRAGHVTRDYSVTVTNRDVSLNVELLLLGDINGDGVISGRDKKLLYNHMEKISELTGYLFKVGDVNGDGAISGRDKKLLYNHMEKVSLLWK